jgi:hypothetical protein
MIYTQKYEALLETRGLFRLMAFDSAVPKTGSDWLGSGVSKLVLSGSIMRER